MSEANWAWMRRAWKRKGHTPASSRAAHTSYGSAAGSISSLHLSLRGALMKTLSRSLFAVVLGTALGLAGTAAQAKTLTLCWAAWDPANALVELSKDFTNQSGVEMKFEFGTLTTYADRFLNDF